MSYQHFLLHLLMKSLNLCMPLQINCDLDPSTTFLLTQLSVTILPIITTIVNFALSTGTFPTHFKQPLVTPLFKTQSINNYKLNNYHSISNLSFITRSQLQDTISDISSYMTSHLQFLNRSKTEFMLTGLPQQIYKISNPSLPLNPPHPHNTYRLCPQPRFHLKQISS